MKACFPGYYRPTRDEFRSLWDDCLFVLDANVLLNCYRYSENTRRKLINVFETIAERLWVPHQVALEYQKRRLDVIAEQVDAYDKIEDLLEKACETLTGQLRSYSRHPFISVDSILGRIKAVFDRVLRDLRKHKADHPDFSEEDPVRDKITALLEGRVGPPYSLERLRQIYELGEKRYEQGIPPGYKDNQKKVDADRYGDLVLWFQVIDHAKKIKKPVVLVTDDRKEDWWWQFRGKTIGPRPELVEEMLKEAGVGLYMYRTDTFMKYAKESLGLPDTEEAIREVKEVRKLTEERTGEVPKTAFSRLEEPLEVGPHSRRLEELAAWTASPLFSVPLDAFKSTQVLGDLVAKWGESLRKVTVPSLNIIVPDTFKHVQALADLAAGVPQTSLAAMLEPRVSSKPRGVEGKQNRTVRPANKARGNSAEKGKRKACQSGEPVNGTGTEDGHESS